MPRAQLIITITDEGKVEVSGPLHDKMVCYALLECGRDVIKDHVDSMVKKSPIIPVSPQLPADFRGPRSN